jgi:hypothetical protein
VPPLYSCAKIDTRLLCAAALTIVLQKLALSERLDSQPESLRMKWQMLSVPRSQGLRLENVVVSEPRPNFAPLLPALRSEPTNHSVAPDLQASFQGQNAQLLCANVAATSVRIEVSKFPVMDTCAKKVGGYPPRFQFGSCAPHWQG